MRATKMVNFNTHCWRMFRIIHKLISHSVHKAYHFHRRQDNLMIKHLSLRRTAITLLLLLTVLTRTGQCQNADLLARSFRDHVTDRVILNDGTVLWGMSVGKKPVRLFVSVRWLQDHHPAFLADVVLPAFRKLDLPDQSMLVASLRDEIDRLTNQTDSLQRAGLLKEIQLRLTPTELSLPEFLILELPKSRLRSSELQSDARRELCRLAILNGIRDIETTHWKSVSEQLQAIPPTARKTTPPGPPTNSDETLQQILAAVDVRLNNATRLVQNGDSVFDESVPVNVAGLIQTALGNNVQTLLNELLNESVPKSAALPDDTLPASARRIAESAHHTTIVLASFQPNLEVASATVTRRLFRKQNDGQWKLVWSTSSTSTSADLKPSQIELLENDPQVQEISRLAEGLGLGGQQLSIALQFGGIVQNAMRVADRDFEERIQAIITTNGLTQAQDTPVLIIAETPASVSAP